MSEWRKSSYSGYNGNCVEVAARWRKSSHSESGNCAEVAVLPGSAGYAIAVRDSKNPGGPQLVFSPAAWMVFLSTVKGQR